MNVTVWDERQAESTAVLVHGTFTWGTSCRGALRPLDRRYRLLVPDRRAFGESPGLEGSEYTSDCEVDAVEGVELLGDGAHLVGHSHGGVVAMLAAATCPEKVHQKVGSVTLIEPGALQAAIGHPLSPAGSPRRAPSWPSRGRSLHSTTCS